VPVLREQPFKEGDVGRHIICDNDSARHTFPSPNESRTVALYRLISATSFD
jgi:hypothetical protein